MRAFFRLWAPLMMLACIPLFDEWLHNRYQVSVQDLGLPLLLQFILSLGVAGVTYRLYKNAPLSAMIAGVFTVLIIGDNFGGRMESIYPVIKALNPIPQLHSYENLAFSVMFVMLAFLVARLLALAVLKIRFIQSIKPADLTGGIAAAIGIIFILQLFSVTKTTIVEWDQFFYRPPALPQATGSVSAKPDIYYIVLDRYTSQSVLSEQFNFDNSDFISFLQKDNFSVDPNAHARYPYTTMSIASTLTAQYHSDMVKKFASASEQTVEPYHDAIRFSPVIAQLKAKNYSYYHLGSWYEASNKAPLADHYFQPEGQLTIFNHTFTLNTFSKNELTQSMFWRLIQHGMSIGNFNILTYGSQDEADATIYKLDKLKQLAAQPSGGRFIFAHIISPHEPYYFNADGSRALDTGTDNNGELIKQKYVRQVEFLNSQMKEIVSSIDKSSNGTAVVVLQSDEGPYPAQLIDHNFNGTDVGEELGGGDMTKWTDQALQMKYGVLAAYRVPAASATSMAAGSDPVNIFRVILNTYLGNSLPYLPACSYAFPSGRGESFVYTDITKRLTGTSNPACSKNSLFTQ